MDFTSGLLQRAFQCEDHKPGHIGRGIAFVDWIRDEEKFHAVGELAVRMKYDARQALSGPGMHFHRYSRELKPRPRAGARVARAPIAPP